MSVFNEDHLQKLQSLEEAEQSPFSLSSENDISISGFTEVYSDMDAPLPDNTHTLTGQVERYNNFGGITFIDIREQDAEVQLAFTQDETSQYDVLENIDTGDFLQVTGSPAIERFDELSVFVSEWSVVSKSLRQRPSYDGLNERNTTVDRVGALVSDNDLFDTVQQRFELIENIRSVMQDRGFTEVDTPMLHATASGASAETFDTHCQAVDQDMHLRIAPELYLKRLITAGFRDIYEIGNNFRNEDADTTHNPEFTMMEVYQAYADWEDMMALTEDLVTSVTDINTIETIEIVETVENEVGDIESYESDEYHIPEGTIREQAYTIYEEEIESTLSATFVTGFPQSVSPLAQTDSEGVPERFELVIDGMEVANGYTEQNNPITQQQAFEDQSGEQDWQYVDDIAYGMPPTGGVGIGIERLAMLQTNEDSIRRVLPFPMHRER